MGTSTKRIQYRFDAAGNRTLMIDPDGGRFTYAYDNMNRISHLVNPQGNRTTYGYDANGRRILAQLTNGTRASFTYDAASRLTRLANLKSDGTTISCFDYQYDRVGNRTAVLENDGSRVTYAYDKTYQLVGEDRTGTTPYRNTFSYDPTGNRLLKNESDSRTTYSYDAANQLRYAEDVSGRTTYTFDADGNQTGVLEPAGSRTTTTWDYENKTTLVQLPSGVRNTMAYDTEGLRVKLGESTGAKKFIWDDQNYLAETNAANDTQVVYTNEPEVYGNLVSQYRNTRGIWVPSYYHFDALGSTRQLTNSAETVSDSYLYDAWGDLLTSSGSTVNPFRYVGRLGYYFDEDTDNFYVRVRIYRPVIARWTSVDPLRRPDAKLQPYIYVRNRLTRGVDPSGLTLDRDLEWCEVCIAKILALTTKDGQYVDVTARVIAHVAVSAGGGIGPSDFNEFLLSMDPNTPKGQVASIAFMGDADAITLGREIHTRNFLRGCGAMEVSACRCKSSSRQREAAIVDLRDAALVGHELVHVAQQGRIGEYAFDLSYLAEYAKWLARGASPKQAYGCISYETEGYAFQSVLIDFFSDPKRLDTFNKSCCEDTQVPQRHRDIIKAGYERRRLELQRRCDAQFPPLL